MASCHRKGVWGITFLQKGFPKVSSALRDCLERQRSFLLYLALEFVEKLAKTLEMHYLTFAEVTDYVRYVRIVGDSQDIVIGGSCFLLWCHYEIATFNELSKRLSITTY